MSTDIDIYAPTDRLVGPEEFLDSLLGRGWHVIAGSFGNPQRDKLGRLVDGWVLYGTRSPDVATLIQERIRSKDEAALERLVERCEIFCTDALAIHPYSFCQEKEAEFDAEVARAELAQIEFSAGSSVAAAVRGAKLNVSLHNSIWSYDFQREAAEAIAWQLGGVLADPQSGEYLSFSAPTIELPQEAVPLLGVDDLNRIAAEAGLPVDDQSVLIDSMTFDQMARFLALCRDRLDADFYGAMRDLTLDAAARLAEKCETEAARRALETLRSAFPPEV